MIIISERKNAFSRAIYGFGNGSWWQGMRECAFRCAAGDRQKIAYGKFEAIDCRNIESFKIYAAMSLKKFPAR
jgi:hypothetical protein